LRITRASQLKDIPENSGISVLEAGPIGKVGAATMRQPL